MAQLPFAVTCGTPNPTAASCQTGYHTEVDKDGSGEGTLYSVTREFSPCAPVVTDTYFPGSTRIPAWVGTAVARIGNYADASRPYIVSPGAFPLPPHCWGWTGSTDYQRKTYYSFAGTLLQITDTANEFGQFDNRYLSVKVDYDVRIVRTFSQRVVVYTRASTFLPFDFTTAASDACSDLSTSDTTTHHTEYSTGGTVDVRFSTNGGWNSVGFLDGQHEPLSTAANQYFTWAYSEYQDSTYFDTPNSNGQRPGTWGSFAEFRPDALTYRVVYQFGRETRTVSNVRFTVSVAWRQFHCIPDGSSGPCNCNNDCPPCQGSSEVRSGKCATICANGAVSPTLVQGWSLKDQDGNVVSSGTGLNGWSVERVTACSMRVCAPCLSPAHLRANDYAGPYTITWGTAETCICDGVTVYKVFTATFTLVADVICQETTPPLPGSSVSYDVSDAIRHARAFASTQTGGANGTAIVGVASDVFPLVWADRQTGIEAERLSLKWDRQSLGSPLYMLVSRNNGILLYRSTDEGITWTLATTIGAGNYGSLVIARDGRRLCYWVKVHDPTKSPLTYDIVGKFLDGVGNVSKDQFTAITGVDLAPIDHDESVASEAVWHVTLLFRREGNIVTQTSIDGVVFGD